MRRTKAQAEQTKKDILQAAEQLFLQQGYDKVSLEAIASEAGVTRGAVHWHFKNKQGLLSAIRIKAQEPLFRLADKVHHTGEVSLLDLEAQVAEFFRELQSDPRWQCLLRVIIKADIAMKESTGEEDVAFHARLNEALLRIFSVVEQKNGLPAPWTAESAATMFASTVTGLMLKWAVSGGKVSLDTDGKAYIKMILASWTV